MGRLSAANREQGTHGLIAVINLYVFSIDAATFSVNNNRQVDIIGTVRKWII